MDSKECRICSKDSNLISVFKEVDGSPLSEQIKSITNVQISESDYLPKYICISCIGKVVEFLEFRRAIESCYEIFYSSSNSVLETASKDENRTYSSEEESNASDYRTMGSDENSIDESGWPERIPSPIQCIKCEMVFVDADDKLWDHMEDVHFLRARPNENKCKHCCRLFSDRESLLAHIETHDIAKKFKCGICCDGFETEEQVKKHMAKWTQFNGEGVFICVKCRKSFFFECALRKHLRDHQHSAEAC